jgi:hypothetical protein
MNQLQGHSIIHRIAPSPGQGAQGLYLANDLNLGR